MSGRRRARGVTWHIKTRRYEAHIWHRTTASRSGAHVFVGAFGSFEAAVHAYDVAAIALKGQKAAHLNLGLESYNEELKFIATVGDTDCIRLLKNGTYHSKLRDFISLCPRDTRVAGWEDVFV